MATNSRVAAQAETRRLLKRSGREILLERGYGAASVAAIAAHAGGFTTGAFYSNYDGKADLTMEVLIDLQAEAATALGAIIDAPASPESKVQQVMDWAETTLSSGWPRLELEFALANRDNPRTISTEADRNRTAVDTLAGIVEQALPTQLAAMPSRRIAELILDVSFGIAVRRIIDPTVTTNHLFDLVSDVVRLSQQP